MACSKICQILILMILIHWFIGLDVFIGILWNSISGIFGFVGDLVSFLLASIFLFFNNLIPIIYGIWTFLALVINIAYMVIVYLFFNYQHNMSNKTIEHFFMMAALCLVVPYIFNWFFFH